MTETQTEPHNLKIEQSIEMASGGSHTAARLVFEGLVDGPLYVPDRHQAQPLSDQPSYPTDLVYVLGLQDVERVVVPVFTRASDIEEWCGLPLSYRCYDGASLFSAIPEQWWIVVNPGSEIEKDLSPWEISRLSEGHAAIDELVEELFSDVEHDTLSVGPVAEEEVKELQAELIAYAKSDPLIHKLILLKEERESVDEHELQKLLLGVEVAEAAERATLKQHLADLANVHQIGKEAVNIFIDTDINSSVTLGLFKNFSPFYTRLLE